MFGIGFFELLVIAVVALVFIGPKRLPDFMKQAGRFFVQMRRTANDVRSTFDQVVQDAESEIRREQAEALKGMLSPKPVTPVIPGTPVASTEPVLSSHVALTDPGHNPDGTLVTTEESEPTGVKPYQPADVAPPASAKLPTEM